MTSRVPGSGIPGHLREGFVVMEGFYPAVFPLPLLPPGWPIAPRQDASPQCHDIQPGALSGRFAVTGSPYLFPNPAQERLQEAEAINSSRHPK